MRRLFIFLALLFIALSIFTVVAISASDLPLWMKFLLLR